MNRQRRGELGQELVEFALLLPLLVLLIFGILELALIMFTHNTLSNAAREGARVGVISGATQEEVCAAVLNRAPGLHLNCPDPTDPPTDPRGVYVSLTGSQSRVVARYDHRLLTGALLQFFGGQGTINMKAATTMRRE